jgi:hypothetical protein
MEGLGTPKVGTVDEPVSESVNQLKTTKSSKPSTAVDAMPSSIEKKEQLELSLAMLDESSNPRDKKSAAILRETLAKKGVDDAWLMAYMGGAPLPELPGKESYTQRDFGNDNPKKIITHRYQMPAEKLLPALTQDIKSLQSDNVDTRSYGTYTPRSGGVPVPVEDTEVPEAAPEEAPKPPIDVTKPVIIRILEKKAPEITKYTPPKFTKDPRALATRIVEEVWAKRPVGNPLTEFFNKNRTESAKQLAIESVMGNVVATRKDAVKISFERWRDEQRMVLSDEQLQIRSQLAEAQVLLANAKANKTNIDATIKKPLSGKDRSQLESQIQLHKDGGRLTAAGKRLLFKTDRDGNRIKGDGIPLGAIRQAAMAANMSLGSITSAPNTSTTVAGGGRAGGKAGIPGVVGLDADANVSGSGSTAGGGAFLDDKKFNEAWAKIDMSNMTRDQQEFMGEMKKTIQTAGKSREGKSLTDKDLEFYMKNLVSETNPSLALININRLMEDNAESYGRVSSSLNDSVTSGMDYYMKPLTLDEVLFTQEEIDGAFESDTSATQDWADRNRPKQPGDSNRGKLNSLLNDLEARLDDATKSGNKSEQDRIRNAIAVELAKQKAKAGGGKSPPKPTADRDPNAF